jgi:hypothetical protein
MSIGPLGGIANSAAGTSLAQTKGSEVERSQHDTSSQQRQIQNDARAEAAAGIGQTDGEDHETADRDADGRSPWRRILKPKAGDVDPTSPPTGKDPSGQSGSQLDLSG